MVKDTITLNGLKVVERTQIRRSSDLFLDQLHDEIRKKTTVAESLDVLLHALKDRNYVCPRIYRKKKDLCLLLTGLDLPPEIEEEKANFPLHHSIFKEIIGKNNIYHNQNVHADPSLILGPQDPQYYISKVGLIGIPYDGCSEIYPKEIKGAIILNYDPLEKIIEPDELRLLQRTGQIVGDKVQSLLEIGWYLKKEKKLKQANRKLHQAVEKLKLQVLLDGPTGLYNHKTFYIHLDHYVQEFHRNNTIYYLIMLDCDNIKRLNDNFGHVEGDKFFSELGEYLQRVSSSNSAKGYRTGGDEFAVVIPSPSQERVQALAENIRQGVKLLPVPVGCEPLTVSIGVIQVNNGFCNGEELYRAADAILYQAKEKKNCVIFRE